MVFRLQLLQVFNILFMKKLSIFIVIGFVFIIYFSCNKIDPPYMKTTVDTAGCPTPTFPVKTTHHKTVLIEEYTGHLCINCPAAAILINGFKQTYGDSLFVIAIHAGGFAEPQTPNYTLDLRCTVGNDLNTHFNIQANPAASFNRKSYSGDKISYTTSEWETKISQAFQVGKKIDMQMIVSGYNAITRKVCIAVQTQYLQTLSDTLKLCVYIIEDSLIGYQKNKDASPEDVPNYVFNHVLRESVNGTMGDLLSNTQIQQNTIKISKYATILNSNINPARCHFIAFIYNFKTEEILQCVEAKLLN